MSATPTSAVAQTPRPDPTQDPAGAGCPAPNRFGRALILVRKLIDYGKALAATLTQHTADTESVALTFGTNDIAAILARIARALHIAAALEATLVVKEALPEPPPRAPRPPSFGLLPGGFAGMQDAPGAAPWLPLAAAADQPAPPAAPAEDGADSRLARLPSAEEIAEMLRRRPIGAVIGELCLDLGIMPSDKLWHEMFMVMLDHGGNPHRVYMAIMQRNAVYFEQLVVQSGLTMQTPWWPPMPEGWSPDAPAAVSTGPP